MMTNAQLSVFRNNETVGKGKEKNMQMSKSVKRPCEYGKKRYNRIDDWWPSNNANMQGYGQGEGPSYDCLTDWFYNMHYVFSIIIDADIIQRFFSSIMAYSHMKLSFYLTVLAKLFKDFPSEMNFFNTVRYKNCFLQNRWSSMITLNKKFG